VIIRLEGFEQQIKFIVVLVVIKIIFFIRTTKKHFGLLTPLWTNFIAATHDGAREYTNKKTTVRYYPFRERDKTKKNQFKISDKLLSQNYGFAAFGSGDQALRTEAVEAQFSAINLNSVSCWTMFITANAYLLLLLMIVTRRLVNSNSR